jgi:hypothetical protein
MTRAIFSYEITICYYSYYSYFRGFFRADFALLSRFCRVCFFPTSVNLAEHVRGYFHKIAVGVAAPGSEKTFLQTRDQSRGSSH